MNDVHNLVIVGEVFKKAREDKKLSVHELAHHFCLSNKHIEQIENGGESVFFSHTHKIQIAHKVAQYLNISKDYAFDTKVIDEVSDQHQTTTIFDQHIQSRVAANLEKFSKPISVIGLSRKLKTFFILIFLGMAGVFVWIYTDQTVPAPMLTNESINKDDAANVKGDISTTSEVTHEEVIEKNPCDLDIQAVSAFHAIKPNFLGNFVYLVNKNQKDLQQICVIDAKKVKSKITLNPGERRTVVGQAPFHILSADFSQINLYYQGSLVSYPRSVMHTVLVEEMPISTSVQEVDKVKEILNKEE